MGLPIFVGESGDKWLKIIFSLLRSKLYELVDFFFFVIALKHLGEKGLKKSKQKINCNNGSCSCVPMTIHY